MVSITTTKSNHSNKACCDLLKKLYLCGVNYNLYEAEAQQVSVVICLKSCIFVVSITTKEKRAVHRCGL